MRCENCGHIMQERDGKLWCKSCKAGIQPGEQRNSEQEKREEEEKRELERKPARRATPFPGVTEVEPHP
jgi:uncharacterized Zn finger protein (UPF0148 family)